MRQIYVLHLLISLSVFVQASASGEWSSLAYGKFGILIRIRTLGHLCGVHSPVSNSHRRISHCPEMLWTDRNGHYSMDRFCLNVAVVSVLHSRAKMVYDTRSSAQISVQLVFQLMKLFENAFNGF